ncbi:MAG: electron transporter RnfB [Spirochaetes bacterium]|nr:MAG: electron transporter RnfB [Spirochaetota bacterium]
MNLIKVLYAFLSVSGLGIVLGIGLAYASKIFTVKKNEKREKLENALPGLNCGACGYAGCSSYAEAIESGEETVLTKCAPGGSAVAEKLAEIMGEKIDVSMEKMVAQVHCRGGNEISKYQYEYSGIKDCNALYAMFDGDKVCNYGCLGLGSCIKVCPVDAISYDSEGLVWVDKEECIGCEKCVEVCPTGVMQMMPYSADYIVACNSKDKGSTVRKYCSVGCIGCKLCEKKSPEGGFKVENFLATIDYKFNGERRAAAEACPTHCIIKNEPHPKKK